MTTPTNLPGFFSRLSIAFGAFFKSLGDAEFAARVRDDGVGPVAMPTPAPTAAPTAAPTPAPTAAPLRAPSAESALQLLGLFQREARLIDFTQENLSAYSDADIGAAARVVHEGCARVLREHFTIEPVRLETEGTRITLEEGFDAASVRLTGNVVGQAPFKGTLSHRGWRASKVQLPQLAEKHDARVLAPAEVEL
ncbi:DUF2760 domain-containing protein [Massilia sp. 9I]|uniref:DUF2760 domain-containing protein n=1 Tax=Massilia sp. 9I TaxID=2653152 RepID=UPI0012F20437|nr:DUF2760 domain-containing protein [Massilia sp. 9I]VXC68848.1 conserved hypothetical protein [Massilia sp. 9I]